MAGLGRVLLRPTFWESDMSNERLGIGARAACVAHMLGAASLLAAVVTRVTQFAPLGVGPRSYAIGAGLLFLCSIAISTCPCCGARSCEKPQE